MKCIVPMKRAFQWNSRNASKFWAISVFPINFQKSAVLPFSPFLNEAWRFFYPFKQGGIFVDSSAFFEFVCHQFNCGKEALYINHPRYRYHPVFCDKNIGGSTAMLMSGEAHLRTAGTRLNQVREGQNEGTG